MVNDITTELFYDGVWNNITPDVRYDPPISVSWGRADEASNAAPSSLGLSLDNTAGKYSPRNPASPLYGKIGRNSPIRLRLGSADAAARLNGSPGDYVSTPDHADLDITGDLDIRIEVTPETWRPVKDTVLAAKYQISGDNRSFALFHTVSGAVKLFWSPDGTFAGLLAATSTEVVPSTTGRLALRATLDVDNGASGRTVTFYTSDSIGGSWAQLGTPVTTAGVTSIFSGASELDVGSGSTGSTIFDTTQTFVGLVHEFELYNGIGGTLVADPSFSTRDPSLTTWTDSLGRVWTLNGTVRLEDPSIRFSGEVTAWPPEWDLSGSDIQVPIEAKGVMRRLNQGAEVLRSPLYRDISTKTAVVAYWPMEEGDRATQFASGLKNDPRLLLPFGDVSLAASTVFVASEALPTVADGRIGGNIPDYTGAADQRIFFLCSVPSAGVSANRILLSVATSGTSALWDIVVTPAGDLTTRAFDSDGVQLFTSTAGFDVNGKLLLVSLWLQQSGADINWQTSTFEVGATVGRTNSGTLTGRTYGRFTSLTLGSALGMGGTVFGHTGVLNDDVQGSFWDTVGNSLDGWSGELAADRMIRLCADEGVTLTIHGDPDGTVPLGPQRVTTLLDLLREAAESDMGVLTDSRELVGLRYRTRATLYNQAVALGLSYSNGDVAPSLEPVEDDQSTRNDITVKREGGSSARSVLEEGPLSVLPPPDGVGRYNTEETLSLETDGQLPDQAGWRLHLGTVDEARYPSISVDLTATPGLTSAAVGVKAGDRVQVENPPAWLPPNTIDQLAQGGNERLTPHRHFMTFNTTPASPWVVGVVGDAELGRADTEESVTSAAFVSGTDTSLLVETQRGPIWTTDPAQFPFKINAGGVVLNATAAADSVVDTFTRSVSGSWGTADSGHTYTVTSNKAGATYDVDGAKGTVTLGADDLATRAALNLGGLPISAGDFDFRVTVSSSAVATGEALVGRILGRFVDSSNFYTCNIAFQTDGNVYIELDKVVAGVGSELSPPVNKGSYSAGTAFVIRFQSDGNSLRVKLWAAAGSEPDAWDIEEVDTSFPNPGGVSIRTDRLLGNTNVNPVISYDDLRGANPQKFTVDRTPVNGVMKTIPSRSAVSLAQPVYVAL